MPRQILKLEQFHGGVNTNSDPRDLLDNELAGATDVMVDELGKIRSMGGIATHGTMQARANQINPGYGLFQFSHDRVDGHTVGRATADPETGADYMAFSEADDGGTVDIYSAEDDTFSGPITGMTDNTSGLRKDVFYYADGALRISDADFGNANEPVWYGYIHRHCFGNGTIGYDQDGYDQGLLITQWFKDEVAPKALAIQSFIGHTAAGGDVPDISNPITIDLDSQSKRHQDVSSSGVIADGSNSITVEVTFSSSSPNVTATAQTNPGFSRFCSIGDKILIAAAEDLANRTVFTVADVPEYGTDPDPNTMDFEEAVTAETTDGVYMYNLSRSAWWDPVNTGWQVAVSTLYDDNKQESALSVSSTTLEPKDICQTTYGYDQIRMDVHVFAGNGSSTGVALIHARVSGFKVYMRRSNTSTWYLQTEIDMTKGSKWFGRGDYEMWEDAEQLAEAAHADGEYLDGPREVETYESETGYDSSITAVGFDGTSAGFKTAVVANNIAYAGNVKIKDWKGTITTHGDAILKSAVGKFDSFVLERRLETSNEDGDSIIKLEEYADRLLEFKKNRMSLINISQELEFLEDTFMHKGVSHPAAVCKTDYGIAWVNNIGCYLYDGQKVNNLLEKGGRQIIKESDWITFTTNEPMIGYIPKKRQLLVVDDNSTTGTGKTFLYDMVTQSWVQGAAATITSQALTNFVIDWNNDLVHVHTSDTGTAVKWDDASDDSEVSIIKTKDIDFGNPGQKKNVYKVVISYKGNADDLVVKFSVNGDTDTLYEFNSVSNPLADYSGDLTKWHVTDLVPTTASQAKNIYSFQLHINDEIDPDTEFNDISIIYRMKGVR